MYFLRFYETNLILCLNCVKRNRNLKFNSLRLYSKNWKLFIKVKGANILRIKGNKIERLFLLFLFGHVETLLDHFETKE